LFVSYERNPGGTPDYGGNIIELFDTRSLAHLKELAVGPSTLNLTGIVYDPARSKLYVTNRNTDDLYVFSWNANSLTLEANLNSPIELGGGISNACGVALDGNTLYASDYHYDIGEHDPPQSAYVYRYDVTDDLLYGGAYGDASDDYLIKRSLDPNETLQKDIGANAIGITTDDDTGLVYITTYRDVDPNDSYIGAVEVWNPSLWTSDPNEEVEPNFVYTSPNNDGVTISNLAGLVIGGPYKPEFLGMPATIAEVLGGQAVSAIVCSPFGIVVLS